MPERFGEQFLDKKDSKLYTSEAVESKQLLGSMLPTIGGIEKAFYWGTSGTVRRSSE